MLSISFSFLSPNFQNSSMGTNVIKRCSQMKNVDESLNSEDEPIQFIDEKFRLKNIVNDNCKSKFILLCSCIIFFTPKELNIYLLYYELNIPRNILIINLLQEYFLP